MNHNELNLLRERHERSAEALASARARTPALKALLEKKSEELLLDKQKLAEIHDDDERVEKMLVGEDTSNANAEALQRRIANGERDCRALREKHSALTSEVRTLQIQADKHSQFFADAGYRFRAEEFLRRRDAGEPIGSLLSDLQSLAIAHRATPSLVFISWIGGPANTGHDPTYRVDFVGGLGPQSNGDALAAISEEVKAACDVADDAASAASDDDELETLQQVQLAHAHAGAIVGAVSCAVVTTAPGGIPDWVQIFPKADEDDEIKARDGRSWFLPEPQKLVDDFNADFDAHGQHHDIPFDLEHSSEIRAPEGQPAPAIGWVKQLEVRNGGEIWANVEFNEAGSSAILTRAYRYVSPAFTAPGGKITKVLSIAATNKPALQMPALAREAKENNMKDVHPKIAAALGLAETASIEDVLSKIEGLKKTNKDPSAGTSSVAPMQNQGGPGLSTAHVAGLTAEQVAFAQNQGVDRATLERGAKYLAETGQS